MKSTESINELAAALSAAQGEMGAAQKGAANPFFKSKYADLGEVVRALKAPFANHGLSYTQFPIRVDQSAGVVTRLMHSSGQWLESEYTLPLSKFDAQAVGSCITYARRYALQAIAGIPSEDDDGNTAAANSPKTDLREQVEKEAIRQDCLDNLLHAYSVKAISELTEADLRKAKRQLADRLKQGGTNAAGN